MKTEKVLIQGAYVAPITRPVIVGGGIVMADSNIVAVGSTSELRRAHPDAAIVDRRDCTILPGLVNAHTHLELSGLSQNDRPESFESWLIKLVPKSAPDMNAMREAAVRSIPIGAAQCIRYGVTTVGDISRQCAVTRPLLSEGPLRVISFGEVQAMASRRHFLDERVAAAADQKWDSHRLRAGISPHAPYSVEIDGYRACLKMARGKKLPITTHLAESRDEAQFLASHAGPFRELWNAIGGWDEQVPRFEGGPIRFAKAIGLLDYPTVLAHVNYCDDDELQLLRESLASVVYCPRTHAYFGHPPHRWQNMLAVGITVAIGTDSCASSPDLNLVDDLRVLRKLAPEIPANELWKLVTIRGAKALGVERVVGSLETGKQADLVFFPTKTDQPLDEILDQELTVRETWIGGTRVSDQIP